MNTPTPRIAPLPPAPRSAAADAASAPASQGLLAARERAIRLLTDRYADDTLGEAELRARLAQLHSVADPAGVDAVVRDLLDPAGAAPPVPVPDERRILAVMGEARRTGRWAVPRLLRVRALLGNVKIDLRDNPIPDGFTLDVQALGSSVTLIVPPGISVAFDVFAVIGNAINQADELGAATSDTQRIRVAGSAVLGEVRVLVRERSA